MFKDEILIFELSMGTFFHRLSLLEYFPGCLHNFSSLKLYICKLLYFYLVRLNCVYEPLDDLHFLIVSCYELEYSDQAIPAWECKLASDEQLHRVFKSDLFVFNGYSLVNRFNRLFFEEEF